MPLSYLILAANTTRPSITKSLLFLLPYYVYMQAALRLTANPPSNVFLNMEDGLFSAWLR